MPKIYLSQLDQLWIKVNTQSVVCGKDEAAAAAAAVEEDEKVR